MINNKISYSLQSITLLNKAHQLWFEVVRQIFFNFYESSFPNPSPPPHYRKYLNIISRLHCFLCIHKWNSHKKSSAYNTQNPVQVWFIECWLLIVPWQIFHACYVRKIVIRRCVVNLKSTVYLHQIYHVRP